MILAFSNDFTVRVFYDVRQANTYCEGVDVEAGVYTFTNEHGFVFTPRFTMPSRRGRLFGLLSWIASDPFTLELTDEQRPDLLADVTTGGIAVCSGPTPLSSSKALQAVLRGGTSPFTEPRA